MDIVSYLLGKKSGGGGTPALQNKSVTITENGTTNVTADTGYDGLSQVEVTTNVSGGGDLSEYFNPLQGTDNSAFNGITLALKKVPRGIIVEGTSLRYAFSNCINLEEVPLLDTSNIEDMRNMFSSCGKLESIPLFDTSNVTLFNLFCGYCANLKNVPLLNTSKTMQFKNMFVQCPSLTDASLDNILQMCINAISYTETKTLKQLGISNTTIYPASRIEALPHYQDFIDAGWTIGY